MYKISLLCMYRSFGYGESTNENIWENEKGIYRNAGHVLRRMEGQSEVAVLPCTLMYSPLIPTDR
jgi:hypothetical protein